MSEVLPRRKYSECSHRLIASQFEAYKLNSIAIQECGAMQNNSVSVKPHTVQRIAKTKYTGKEYTTHLVKGVHYKNTFKRRAVIKCTRHKGLRNYSIAFK